MSLSESLSVLIEDGIIEEVHGRIMIGKEAEVYAVRFPGPYRGGQGLQGP
jgi:serine/threonine-protein kinase RIO1